MLKSAGATPARSMPAFRKSTIQEIYSALKVRAPVYVVFKQDEAAAR